MERLHESQFGYLPISNGEPLKDAAISIYQDLLLNLTHNKDFIVELQLQGRI